VFTTILTIKLMHNSEPSYSQRYVPTYAQNPVGLAWKLLAHPNPAARSALFFAIAGLLLSPLDKITAHKERSLLNKAAPPVKPILLVCGPPRSGTTLVVQYLINSYKVNYINNLSSLFPRSSIYVNQFLAKWVKPRAGEYSAFYGKSVGLAGNNDGLFLWDRWLGYERDKVPEKLMPNATKDMANYFGAINQNSDLPIVNKANRIISSANLIQPILPTARFIFLWRNPVMLAQSLLVARKQLTGDLHTPYGLHSDTISSEDPIEDVCSQVEFLHSLMERQLHQLKKDAVLVVNYSDFCRSPNSLLDQIQGKWNLSIETRFEHSSDFTFSEHNAVKIPNAQFVRMQKRLSTLRTPSKQN